MKFKLSSPKHEPVTIDEGQAATICLHKCGGGYTERQTAKAMIMLTSIKAGKPIKTRSGFTLEAVPDENV